MEDCLEKVSTYMKSSAMSRGGRSQAATHEDDASSRHGGNYDDSEDYSDEEDEIYASRRLKRMRHLEPNKEMVILMPQDNAANVLGLEKNELEEFQGCLEEVYEWIPEQTKGNMHGDHGKSHGKGQQPNLPAKLSSAGFNFDVASSSSHGYGGTAIEKSTLPLFMTAKAGEVTKEVFVPQITIVQSVTAEKERAAVRMQRETTRGASSSGGASTGNSSGYPNDDLSPLPAGPAHNRSYCQYDADEEDMAFLRTLVGTVESSSKASNGKSGASKKGVPPDLARRMNVAILSDMLMVLERGMELSDKFLSHRSDIDEAMRSTESIMGKWDAVSKLATGIGSREPAQALQDAMKIQSILQKEKAKDLKKHDSRASLASSAESSGSKVSLNNNGEVILEILTQEELRKRLPYEQASALLIRVFEHHTRPDAAVSPFSVAIDAKYRPLVRVVYEYWVSKRANRKSSLLRCYHDFIMENWHRGDLLPQLPEDTRQDNMLAAHERLLRMRRDLDKARLIMDRVRRREKVKRDLVRAAGEGMDCILEDVEIVDEKDEKEQKGVGKKGLAMRGGASLSLVARQPRAAKQLAKAKIENPSATLSTAEEGYGRFRGDNTELLSIPFELEPIEYEAILPAGAGVGALGMNGYTDSFGMGIPTLSSGSGSEGRSSNFPAVPRLDITKVFAEGDDLHATSRGFIKPDNTLIYSDYDPRRSNSRGNGQFASSPTSGASGWTADEDRLLLMGVAACGVGRWTEIREDFLLARNSAQMNQRFTRLAKRRCMLIEINSSSGDSKDKKGMGVDDAVEYADVRTAYMSPGDVAFARSKLPPLIISMLDKYSEDSIWESIAVRHLMNVQNKDKRCGRPQKYPLPIPIPKHLQNGGHLNRKKSIVQRPSELGYNWKGALKSPQAASFEVTERPIGQASPSSRKRGRPPKVPHEDRIATSARNDHVTTDIVSEMDDLDSIGSWSMDKSREQSHSREARKKAREKVSDAISKAAMQVLAKGRGDRGDSSGDNGKSFVSKKARKVGEVGSNSKIMQQNFSKGARCSLGSLSQS